MSDPYDTLKIGDEAVETRLCRAEDLIVFAHASGNFNPLHIADQDGDGDGQAEAIAPAMWLASLISAVLGNQLPGPGTVYQSQNLTFVGQARAGDTLTAKVKIVALDSDRIVDLETSVATANGDIIVTGKARVTAPKTIVALNREDVAGVTVQQHIHFAKLITDAEPLPPLATAVVAPEEPDDLAGAIMAAEHTLIAPILIGDTAKINAAAEARKIDLSPFQVVHEPDHKTAAASAVAMVHEGRVQAIMKGHLHTDVLLAQIVKRDGGLRGARRLSHVFVMDVPGFDHPLLITDAAINIAPDLTAKVDIIQNAIDLARAIGITEPKVGVLSAVETVNPAIPSTLDAAILSKMAERGQITGGIVDGPLAMDNAVDLGAARTKGITSMVAGRADVLIAPNLESGNMLAKELTFLAHAQAGGIVMGAACPIILTSRADSDSTRLASCAIAALVADANH